MIPPVIQPVVRRAIIDLLTDVGGEHNHDELAMLLAALGHRVAARDIAEQLRWLADQGLVVADQVGPYVVARVLADGRDVSAGRLAIDGVSRHKTGD